MIIKNLHIVRRSIATSILAIFSIVFICDFLCDLGFINYALTHEVKHSHEVVTDGHHDQGGNNNHGHDFESTMHETTHRHKHDDKDEDCCEEESNRFYASLVNHEFPQFDLDYDLVHFAEPWFSELNFTFHYKETDPYRLKSTLSPPSGAFVRILFQSFLC